MMFIALIDALLASAHSDLLAAMTKETSGAQLYRVITLSSFEGLAIPSTLH